MISRLCLVYLFSCALNSISCQIHNSSFKHNSRHHPVPTYFRHTNEDGSLVDRKGRAYAQDVGLPIISTGPATDATLVVHPEIVDNGGLVEVHWEGVEDPQEKDWIGFYCPEADDPHHYLDYIKVAKSPTWMKGYGSASVYVYNMRTTCNFKYYRNNKYSQLVAISNRLSFIHGSEKPMHGHLALTGIPSEMVVMWNSGTVEKPHVRYGIHESSLDSVQDADSYTYKANDMCGPPASTTGFWNPGYMHRATLKGLRPQTTYYYTYGSNKVTSLVRNFTTALEPGDHTPFKFVAYGDMGVSAYPGGHETSILMQREVVENGVRLIVHDGDISYAEGMAYIWEQWFTLIEDYASLVPYMVSIGNHEQDHTTGGSKDPSGAPGEGFHPKWGNYGDDSGGECGVAMYNRFKMPDNGNGLWWYSFDFGMVHFIIMSTEHDFTPSSRQYKWLLNDLERIDRKATPWVVLLGHRPMYCSGYYPGDYKVTVYMRKYLEEIFFKYKVDVAIWGHYHSYERTCKVYQETCNDAGTLHLMIGSAGASLDSGVYYHKEWSAFREDTYGYGRFTAANATSLFFEFVRNKDQVVTDEIWLHK